MEISMAEWAKKSEEGTLVRPRLSFGQVVLEPTFPSIRDPLQRIGSNG